MRRASENGLRPRIVHELDRRIRIRHPGLFDSAFDSVYLEAALKNIPGVERVRFNLRTASAVIAYDGSTFAREGIIRCMETLPEEAYRPQEEQETGPDPVGTGAKGTLAVLTPAVPGPFRFLPGWGLSLPVLLKGIETLLTRGIKVEVLDAAAVGFSLWRKDYVAATSITALLALGEYLEDLSEAKAGELLKNLLRPQVEVVWVEREGREIRLDLDDLVIGDRVLCGAGEMIPVDGRVLAGEASVNQSSITGESVPVHLKPGDDAMSGSVIHEGRLQIDARQVGSDTAMARINRFLENSLRGKSASQRRSSELADRLVPATFAIGLLLFGLTRDVRRASAVLTVDYSCAIKLANPVAVRTAMYTAAHSGVLLKGAQALESFAGVDTLVFDKTGTLTRGVLEVTDVLSAGELTSDQLLALAAGAEEHYVHPVARAVVAEAGRRGLALPPAGQVDFIVAHGVSAYVDGDRVLVGSRHFIDEDEGIDCSMMDPAAHDFREQGKTLLYVARERNLEGIIALRDALRPEADSVLQDLKRLGIREIVALTGDHRETALAVADRLGALDRIHWDLKPEEKAGIIKNLQEEGRAVAFVGDGVNDAPALVTADVGVCMPGGADLAREAAQVVLLEDDLTALATACRIASRTGQTLRNCFGATVGLNTVFLVLAASGLLAPVTAAVLHNANTVGILGYAALCGLQDPGAPDMEPE